MRFFEDNENKKTLYLFLSIIIISALIFFALYLWYNDKLTEEAEISILNMSNGNLTNEVKSNERVAEVSFSEDKDIKNTVVEKNTTAQNIVETKTKVEPQKKEEKNVVETAKISKQTDTTSVPEEEFEGNEIEIKDYVFEYEAPVSGDIIKDFAEDSLVYSKTLDEWTTHLGIDIRADKTTVVKSAEKGTIESIKNDPRYGLTIIINHEDGMKTVYSNLLSTEFVNVGDTVEKGQAIGTVGQSSSFETADEAHLHFEMYKDGKNVNPTIYLK